MPVVIPDGYEENWLEQIKDAYELKGLLFKMNSWSPNEWIQEDLKKRESDQMSLF